MRSRKSERAQAWVSAFVGVEGGGLDLRGSVFTSEFKIEECEFKVQEEKNRASN